MTALWLGLFILLLPADAPFLTVREAAAPAPEASPRPAVEVLPDADVAALLSPLRALEAPGTEATGSPAAGRALPVRRGKKRETVGGPPAPPERSPTGPLTVIRRSPEGDVALAPYLSVTFSQPMVAVGSHGDARESVPVKLVPQPPGQWRWLGTATVMFEPENGFPQATEYLLEVPAGTRSARGASFASAERWTFTTPPPALLDSVPSGTGIGREPVLVAWFDQRVDPASVLEHVQVRVGTTPCRIRLAQAGEVEGDEDARIQVGKAGKGRSVAFRCQERLPPDTDIAVRIAAGVRSAEGPRVSAEPEEWSFRTYGRFRVVEGKCEYEEECQTYSAIRLRLSNAVDPESFDSALVGIEPAVEGAQTALNGRDLVVNAPWQPRTAYTVTISDRLRDVYGQGLEGGHVHRFLVSAAGPAVWAEGGPLVVLDPSAPPAFTVYSSSGAGLALRAYAVGPQDWAAYQEYLHPALNAKGKPAGPPGRLVIERQVAVHGPPDRVSASRLDLAALFPGGLGQGVLVVETLDTSPSETTVTPFGRLVVWVQATRIGLDVIADAQSLTVWATSLSDGRPLADVQLELPSAGRRAVTGPDGLAALALADVEATVLVARRGGDVALLPRGGRNWKKGEAGSLYWHVFDDRHLYRPGEEARLKGWVRLARKDHDLVPAAGRVRYRVLEPDDTELMEGEVALNAFGGFDLALRLPEGGRLGSCMVELTAVDAPGDVADKEFSHRLQVEEFRRPEFEVKASASPGPYLAGEPALLDVEAKYYGGGALAGGAVSWRLAAEATDYEPPGWGEFSFGVWTPWWEESESEDREKQAGRLQGRADARGRHRVRVDFGAFDPPGPAVVTAWASVQDVNRQESAASTSLLVHPSALYVGLRTRRYFVRKGETLAVEAVVTDLDGRAVAGQPIALRAERLLEEWINQERRIRVTASEDCQTRSAAAPARCDFTAGESGTYRITATVADAKGRPNRSQIRRWVAGARTPSGEPAIGGVPVVTLVPDKKEYAAGDVAEVLVQAPFVPAEGLMTLRRDGVIRAERFAMAGASHVLRIPIEGRWTPNVHVQVDLVGTATASAGINLSIPARARRLTASVAPRERTLAPGGRTTVDLELRDAEGKPVRGEIALVVADEAVLALAGKQNDDPLESFYGQHGAGTWEERLRALVIRPRRGVFPLPPLYLERLETLSATGVLAGISGEDQVRSDFRALALFAPSVLTDEAGRASVPVTLPDSLTRYRVLAVAADAGGRFGMGESTLTARLPLMVRPSPPRFLHAGDRFELPVVVQNLTDQPQTVEVAVRMAGVQLDDRAGRRVAVPAGDRVEVRFAALADRVGTARFQTAAAAGHLRDAAETSAPVRPPAPAEVFATYGTLADDEAAVLPVQAPREALPGTGGLEIGLSSTALSGLSDAVLYLTTYPYECAEQVASRVLALAALRDVMQAFRAKGLPGDEELKAAVERDIARLEGLQHHEGGFSFWPAGKVDPFVSVHATHALLRARQAGFAVPEKTLEDAHGYLKDIDDNIPSDWGPHARLTVQAYALDVRRRLGDADPATARALLAGPSLEGVSLEALGWLAPLLATERAAAPELDAVRRHWANRVRETAAGARFVDAAGGGGPLVLHGERRADALILDALLGLDPADPLIPKLAQELLAGRRGGRWSSTQENVFVLLALERYFRTLEAVTPDFVARAWLGQSNVGEGAFRGRAAPAQQLAVPLARLAAGRMEDLVLAREGAGRLYYRVGLRHVPLHPDLAPAEHGFTVERSYAAVDDPGDVRRDADGTWRIRAGARVRATVRVLAPAGGHHVALVDPLPAGLEAINPALSNIEWIVHQRVREDADEDEDEPGPRWDGFWFDYQSLRDDRVEVFAQRLGEGVFKYGYLARATTPGRFLVPPPRVEEMYQPETFGRGATVRVVVE